jgi:hypothetical protein
MKNVKAEKKPGDIWGDKIEYFASGCDRVQLPSYRATNAYGATFTVEKSRQIVTAIADFEDKSSKWQSSFKISVSGEEARSLVQNLNVRLSGTLSDWKPGSPVACGEQRQSPRSDLPVDRSFELCLVSGSVDLFEVVDTRDGRVLFSSRRHGE